MSNIPVVDRVTSEQWAAAFADQHLSEVYRSKNSNKQELTDELTNRIKAICEQRQLSLPKQIVFTSQLSDAIRVMNTGELHVHPLTLVACKLERSAMSPKHQVIYKQLEKYISEKESRTAQYISSVTSTEHKDAAEKLVSEFTLDMNALTQKYRSELLPDIKDYKYVLPSKEFDEVLANSLVIHRGLKFDKVHPTVTKLASIALAALSAYKVGGAIGSWTSESMNWPVAISAASLAAALTYKSVNGVVHMWRVLNVISDKDAKALFSKPLDAQSAETKIIWSKIELNKAQALSFA